jgi:RyR domain
VATSYSGPMVEIRTEDVERVAREVHEMLRGSLDGGSPYRAQAYDDLDDHIKEANRQQVLRAPALLAELGYRVEQGDGPAAATALDLTDEEIERASIAEHEGWMRQKTSAGYRYGPVRDDLTRAHPYLVPWEELTESVRALDRQRVRLLPWIAHELGLRVTR